MRNHYQTYHPLNGAPVNSSPPASNIMLATAGRAYHFKPSFSNQGYLVKNNTKITLECAHVTIIPANKNSQRLLRSVLLMSLTLGV